MSNNIVGPITENFNHVDQLHTSLNPCTDAQAFRLFATQGVPFSP